MKRSMIHYALTIIMAAGFAVSCGKDGKSGGGGGVYNNGLVVAGSVTPTTTETVNAFNTWYQGQESFSGNGCGQIKVTRLTKSAQSGADNCKEKSFLGIKFYVCAASYNGSSGGTPTESTTTVSCSANVRSADANLASIVNSGQIIEAYQSTTGYGVIYVLTIKASEANAVTYVIDSSYPAALAPLQKVDISTGVVTNLGSFVKIGN